MSRLAMLLVLALAVFARAGEVPTVGIEGRLEILLPGTALLAKATDRTSRVTVRIASTRPHGALTEYDLRYIGLVPGKHDLRQFLVREDGSTTNDLPALEVQIAGLLPAQHRGELLPRSPEPLAALGGYKFVISAVVALWALVVIPLFLAGRKRKAATEGPAPIAPPTLAERLRPLVELATAGRLTTDQQAQLERMLLSHWRERLGLESVSATEAIARLREHSEAGVLLRALEDWLHRRPGTAKVDLDAVLAPYAKG
jgi:hypothetical protein